MKKIILSILAFAAFALVGCDENSGDIHEFIDIEPGYEVVSAEFNGGGILNCFVSKASQEYEPTTKALIVFGENGEEKHHYYFKEQYGNQSKKRNNAVIKYLSDNNFIRNGDSVVCTGNEIRVIKLKE